MNEQHYSPSELAQKWHLSVSTVRRMFEKHGGVLVINRPEKMHKRGYRTIRIPKSVAEEIYRRHFVPSANRNGGRVWSESVTAGCWATADQNPRPAEPSAFRTPAITIFANHARDCTHRRDEFFQHCACPKSFSFMELGMNRTLRSGTRSWKEAEKIKQDVINLAVTDKRLIVSCAITEVRSRVLLGFREAVAHLGCTEEALRKAIECKELFAWRFGKYTYLNRTELMALNRQGLVSVIERDGGPARQFT